MPAKVVEKMLLAMADARRTTNLSHSGYAHPAVVLVSQLQSTVPPITPPPRSFFFPALFSGQRLCVNRMWELYWNVFKSCTPPSSPLAAVCVLPATSASDKYRESSGCAEKGTAWSCPASFSCHPYFLTFIKYGKIWKRAPCVREIKMCK